jgi:hypothetical protein
MMVERTCAHISALTTVKHAKRLPCDECVKIQAVLPHLISGQFVEHWNPSILQENPALFRISTSQGTVERTRS